MRSQPGFLIFLFKTTLMNRGSKPRPGFKLIEFTA